MNIQLKAVASMFFDRANQASRYYGRLLKEVDGIFDSNHKHIPYYTSAYTLYKLEFFIRNKMLDSQYRKFRYHILTMLKYYVMGAEGVALNSRRIEKICEEILAIVNDQARFLELINDTFMVIIKKIVDDMTDSEVTKRQTTNDELKKAVLAIR